MMYFRKGYERLNREYKSFTNIILIYSWKIDYRMNQYLTENGIASFVSDKHAAYLCNAAYFHMLKKYNGRAVFIHIPTYTNITEDDLSKLAELIGLIDVDD